MVKREENYGGFLDLLDLVFRLGESAEGITQAEIAERYTVHTRTAQRMLGAVANFFAGDFEERREGRQKFFKLRARRLDTLTLNSFTEDELAAFPIAAKTLRRNNLEPQAKALERAGAGLRLLLNLQKPKTVTNLEDRLRYEGLARRPGPRQPDDEAVEAVVAALREALLSFHQVKITYDPGKGLQEYTLIPLGFLYGERRHYLVARHADGYKGGEPRHFILSRIRNVEPLDEDFEEDQNFSLEEHAARSFGVYQEPPFDVEWCFTPAVADEAEKFLFHPSQQVSHNPDGSLTVRFKAGGRLEMAWHLFTWGREVTVVKPAGFWEKLRKEGLLPEF
jgi:predicted DNA-binding transcriptional regulator YafY